MDYKQLLFTNETLRRGGFYELAIQVSPSEETESIKKYLEYIFQLENVEGPYDPNFKEISLGEYKNQGILWIDDKSIPFNTFNITEDKPGFNWFDVSFYTATIEHIFGQHYQTWTEDPKSPPELDDFLDCLCRKLYQIYPFQLAMIDFETSGQLYFDDLKDDLRISTKHKFYVGKENYEMIFSSNKKQVIKID